MVLAGGSERHDSVPWDSPHWPKRCCPQGPVPETAGGRDGRRGQVADWDETSDIDISIAFTKQSGVSASNS